MFSDVTFCVVIDIYIDLSKGPCYATKPNKRDAACTTFKTQSSTISADFAQCNYQETSTNNYQLDDSHLMPLLHAHPYFSIVR